VAVAAIVAGWALAQRPQLLPGLTVEQAAAGDATLVALLVSIAIGSVILIPSLVLLFSLVLRGRFDERPDEPGSLERAGRHPVATGPPAREPGRSTGVAAAVCAALGVPLTFLSDAGVVLALGVVLLLVAVAAAAVFAVPRVIADVGEEIGERQLRH
jgi:cytochrome d ubiquinol oxidase subunit II